MPESRLRTLSIEFAVEILKLVKQLKDRHETIVSNQIGRAGTSIGANIHEAQYAHGKSDFIAKLQIALKESNETGYWLELLLKTNYIDEIRLSMCILRFMDIGADTGSGSADLVGNDSFVSVFQLFHQFENFYSKFNRQCA